MVGVFFLKVLDSASFFGCFLVEAAVVEALLAVLLSLLFLLRVCGGDAVCMIGAVSFTTFPSLSFSCSLCSSNASSLSLPTFSVLSSTSCAIGTGTPSSLLADSSSLTNERLSESSFLVFVSVFFDVEVVCLFFDTFSDLFLSDFVISTAGTTGSSFLVFASIFFDDEVVCFFFDLLVTLLVSPVMVGVSSSSSVQVEGMVFSSFFFEIRFFFFAFVLSVRDGSAFLFPFTGAGGGGTVVAPAGNTLSLSLSVCSSSSSSSWVDGCGGGCSGGSCSFSLILSLSIAMSSGAVSLSLNSVLGSRISISDLGTGPLVPNSLVHVGLRDKSSKKSPPLAAGKE